MTPEVVFFEEVFHCKINVVLVFHEILCKKNFTLYPSKRAFSEKIEDVFSEWFL